MAGRIVKTGNALSAVYSYFMSTFTGKVSAPRMPLSISAELTNKCNLNCPECYSGSLPGLMKRKRGFMSFEIFSELIDELEPYLFYLSLYFQGEPMLHPQFFTFLRKSRGIRSAVATNGHFLSPENSEKLVLSGLGNLIISLDGMDKASYSAYRINGDYVTVMDGIKNIAEARKKYSSKLNLQIQFLVNKYNEHQIPMVKAFARRIPASVKLKSMQIINIENAGYWLPSKPEFSRYEKRNGEYVIKNSLPDRCARLWFNPVITWDGKVIPCCFDKDAHHIMGDLNEESFHDIWHGLRYNTFRKSILSGRNLVEICRNCTSGLPVRIKH